jgi:hypothetical protein
VLSADSLFFDLSGVGELAPGAGHDFSLELDVLSAPRVEDFRLALDARGIDAIAGEAQLQGIPLQGQSLPWLSPMVHLTSSSLHESFRSYPNPFTPAVHGRCNITFFLAADARVSADIYTLNGERVANLVNAVPLAAGLHDDLVWDGRNGRGEMVRSGTYLLRLVVQGPGGGEIIRRLAVMR